jgi:hypothetical protein
MHVLKCFLLIVMALIGHASRAQTSFYDLIVAGKNVGELRVFNYEAKSDTEMHRVESNFKFLFYSGQYLIRSNYVNGLLVNAIASHHVNGDLKEMTQTKALEAPKYRVTFSKEDESSGKSKDFNIPISKTITSLYYKEPVNIREVYSERFGQMCSIKKTAADTYKVNLPDGKEGIYSYKNGQCREVTTDLAGFKLRIVLNDKKTSL